MSFGFDIQEFVVFGSGDVCYYLGEKCSTSSIELRLHDTVSIVLPSGWLSFCTRWFQTHSLRLCMVGVLRLTTNVMIDEWRSRVE